MLKDRNSKLSQDNDKLKKKLDSTKNQLNQAESDLEKVSHEKQVELAKLKDKVDELTAAKRNSELALNKKLDQLNGKLSELNKN